MPHLQVEVGCKSSEEPNMGQDVFSRWSTVSWAGRDSGLAGGLCLEQ